MTKMRNVGTVEVSEVLLGNDLYQRQSFTKPIWFIAKNDSWDWVGYFKQEWLEREWDRLQETGGNPFLADGDNWTEEEIDADEARYNH